MHISCVAAATQDCTRKSEGDAIALADGRLFLAYMEFFGNGHDDACTRIVAVESTDGGFSWSAPRVLAIPQEGDLNVYSPNLLRATDGGILLIYMRQHTQVPRCSTLVAMVSHDEGATFALLAEFMPRTTHSLCNGTLKRLASGRLLLPTCCDAPAPKSGQYEAALVYSDDDGLTWCESPERIRLPMRGVMEPHVEETVEGRVMMVMRSQLGAIFLSESADDGVTWSLPQTTGLRSPESCPEMSRHPVTGDLLLIWNDAPYNPGHASHYGRRTPLRAARSSDGGKTWVRVGDIENDPARAFSNPGCRFIDSGHAVVNYWTCEYLPNGSMQSVIDLRVAMIPAEWFLQNG